MRPPTAECNTWSRLSRSGQAEGLFALATQRSESPFAPSLAFWRDFAARYLTELCHTPDSADAQLGAIPPPAPSEWAGVLSGVPPMQGAEYLTEAALDGVWSDLDTFVRRQVAAFGRGLSGFLKERAPLWHQVGRVCFHLAENRRDPAYPFAFMATYAPSLAGGTRVEYQQLSNALKQYAGAKDKKTLIKLLSPVHLASQKSPLVQELVKAGDIFQPLAWTPTQAYRFLKDVPVYEESGVLVRLPNWWKKRPRPRVGVTIGNKRQKKFDARGMLDFQVRLALGDQELSESEWRELLAGEEGLVLLRGQWVEVDRDKLTEALAHWQKLQAQAADGLSFVEGMRLLAGAPGTWPRRATSAIRLASGRSSTRVSGWANCWLTCGVPRTSSRLGPAANCMRPSAGIKRRGSTGSGSYPVWGWGHAWRTIWGWVRRSKCWPCWRR